MTTWPETIAAYARAAFCTGLAEAGPGVRPLPLRTRTALTAAVRTALHHPDTPRLMEATIDLGRLEGHWAVVFNRRQALLDEHLGDLRKLTARLAKAVDVERLVGGVHSAYLIETARTVESHNQQSPDTPLRCPGSVLAVPDRTLTSGSTNDSLTEAIPLALIAVAISITAAALRHAFAAVHHDWHQTTTTALTQAAAFGWADGQLLTAVARGQTPPDVDQAAADRLQTLTGSGALVLLADASVSQQLDWTGRLAARRLASAITAGAPTDQLIAVVRAAIADPAGAELALDTGMSAALADGQSSAYEDQQVDQVEFLTAGDAAVCAECDDAESGSPYTLDTVPDIPVHPGCRCITSPVEDATSLAPEPAEVEPAAA